ncbi:MAG TPA: adenylate/guanylate cyclase domain-containing protein [Candidatus Obscuribacterales bacterium]
MNTTREFKSLDDLLETDVTSDYTLRIQGGGLSCDLDLAPILIGRDKTCEMVLPVSAISRFHCVLYRSGRHAVIRDLHSTNGVFLNQVRVYQAPLRVGDEFQLGDERFRVVLGPPREQKYSKSCAVMFMDVANSTRLTELYGQTFSHAIHQEIARIEDQIFWNRGCPIKHLGDGLMCAFGIWPEHDLNPADAALRAALIAIYHIEKTHQFPGLGLRVGLAFGEVTVPAQENLDLFGDTVNLSSRLEFSNKLYGTSIMMSEEFYNQLEDRNCIREVDTVRVKGKLNAVRIYTYDSGQQDSRSALYAGFYRLGLEQYRQGDFVKAGVLFERAAAYGDPPGHCMNDRVMQMLSAGIPTNWDGIWNLEKE